MIGGPVHHRSSTRVQWSISDVSDLHEAPEDEHVVSLLTLNYQLCWHLRQFLDVTCSSTLLQGRVSAASEDVNKIWMEVLDRLVSLFTSHLCWSPRPLLHSWQPMRPVSVSDRDGEITRARPSRGEIWGRRGKESIPKKSGSAHFLCCTVYTVLKLFLWLIHQSPPEWEQNNHQCFATYFINS